MAALINLGISLESECQRQIRELFQREGVVWMFTSEGKKLLKNLETIETMKALNGKRNIH